MMKPIQRRSKKTAVPRSLERVVGAMSDEELFDAIREQVNKARNQTHGHNRTMTKAIGEEMVRRGWRNSPNADLRHGSEPLTPRNG